MLAIAENLAQMQTQDDILFLGHSVHDMAAV